MVRRRAAWGLRPEWKADSQAALNDVIVGAIVVIVSLLETWALVRPPLKAA